MELDFGGESGSERMQEFVCKDVTADEIVRSVENLHRWAPTIDPFVSWLSGLPGETYGDMEKTFDLMDAMGRANPRTQHYGIFMYTPFPSPLLDSLPPEFRRRSRSRSGAASRSSTSCRPGTPSATSASCARSRR